MKAYTLRLDENRAKFLKHLSIEEGSNMRSIIIRLLDEYIESHKETLEILSHKGWLSTIKRAENDVHNKKTVSHTLVKKMLDVED